MARNISQVKVIAYLKKYLEWHNLPIPVSEEGICNGLTAVYIGYVLNDKETEFEELLQYVAGREFYPDREEKINNFVAQVILSHSPEKYDKRLNQLHAIKTQGIYNNSLKLVFSLPLVTTDKNWQEIIAAINLQTNEVMWAHSLNHAIAITKKEGKYIIYDPNYEAGKKIFTNEAQLIKELHNNVFVYDSLEMGLGVNIVTSLNQEPRVSLPSPDQFYPKYLSKENVSQRAAIGKLAASTIELAAQYNDPELITSLLDLGEIDQRNLNEAAVGAVVNNNAAVLEKLFPFLNKDHLEGLLLLTLRKGRKETFDILMQDKQAKEIFAEFLHEFPGLLCMYAAKGGDLLLLEQIIAVLTAEYGADKKGIIHAILQEHKYGWNALTEAIKSQTPGCVILLLNELDKLNYTLNDKEQLNYLLLAIKKNQPEMVGVFMSRVSKELPSALSFNLLMVEKMDLSILCLLKDNGVNFSEEANGIIARKAHQSLGILLTIGIALKKFTDFFKEFFLRTEGVYYDENKFFKQTNMQENDGYPDGKEIVSQLNA